MSLLFRRRKKNALGHIQASPLVEYNHVEINSTVEEVADQNCDR